ncbi:uncharacterized protein LOC134763156 [Penaeus indicus]|uniref:uncharacterized protein LOC134763156 n=1 Tax=Penaeus indicus TaxID=29960 RepID=UPI00300CEBD9
MWTHEILKDIWNGENIPEDWRTNIPMPVYKQKGDVLECGKHRGIKLLEHLLKDTYESITTMVRTPQGTSEEFGVKAGLHEGSSLSPLLFIIVLDVVSEECGGGLLWEIKAEINIFLISYYFSQY